MKMRVKNTLSDPINRKNYQSLINLENSYKENLLLGVSSEGPQGFDQNFINLNDLSNLTLKKNFMPLSQLKQQFMVEKEIFNYSIPNFFDELMIDNKESTFRKRYLANHKNSTTPKKNITPAPVLRNNNSQSFPQKKQPTTLVSYAEDTNAHHCENKGKVNNNKCAYRIKNDSDFVDSSLGNWNEINRQPNMVKVVNARKATKNKVESNLSLTPSDSMKTQSLKLGFADNNLSNDLEIDDSGHTPGMVGAPDIKNTLRVPHEKERAKSTGRNFNIRENRTLIRERDRTIEEPTNVTLSAYRRSVGNRPTQVSGNNRSSCSKRVEPVKLSGNKFLTISRDSNNDKHITNDRHFLRQQAGSYPRKNRVKKHQDKNSSNSKSKSPNKGFNEKPIPGTQNPKKKLEKSPTQLFSKINIIKPTEDIPDIDQPKQLTDKKDDCLLLSNISKDLDTNSNFLFQDRNRLSVGEKSIGDNDVLSSIQKNTDGTDELSNVFFNKNVQQTHGPQTKKGQELSNQSFNTGDKSNEEKVLEKMKHLRVKLSKEDKKYLEDNHKEEEHAGGKIVSVDKKNLELSFLPNDKDGQFPTSSSLSERDIFTSMDESEIKNLDVLWANFNFKKDQSLSNKSSKFSKENLRCHKLGMNSDKFRKFIENHQLNLQPNIDNLKEEFSKYKFKLCEELSTLVHHYRIFKITEDVQKNSNIHKSMENITEKDPQNYSQKLARGAHKYLGKYLALNVPSSGLSMQNSKQSNQASANEGERSNNNDKKFMAQQQQNNLKNFYGFGNKKTIGIKAPHFSKQNGPYKQFSDSHYESSVISLDNLADDVSKKSVNEQSLNTRHPIVSENLNQQQSSPFKMMDNMTLKSPYKGDLEIIQDHSSNVEDESINISDSKRKKDIQNRTVNTKNQYDRHSGQKFNINQDQEAYDNAVTLKYPPLVKGQRDSSNNIQKIKRSSVAKESVRSALTMGVLGHDKHNIIISHVKETDDKLYNDCMINYNSMYSSAILPIPFTQAKYQSLDLWKYGTSMAEGISMSEEIFNLQYLHHHSLDNKPAKKSSHRNLSYGKDNKELSQFIHKEINELMILDSSNIMVKQIATMIHSLNDKSQSPKLEEKFFEKLLSTNQDCTELGRVSLDIENIKFVNFEGADQSFTEDFIIMVDQVNFENVNTDESRNVAIPKTQELEHIHRNSILMGQMMIRNLQQDSNKKKFVNSIQEVFVDDEEECLDLEDANYIEIGGEYVNKNQEWHYVENTMDFSNLQQTLQTSEFLNELNSEKAALPSKTVVAQSSCSKKNNPIMAQEHKLSQNFTSFVDHMSSNHIRPKSPFMDSDLKSLKQIGEKCLKSSNNINFSRNVDKNVSNNESYKYDNLDMGRDGIKREIGPFDYDLMDQMLEASKKKNQVWLEDKVFKANETIICDHFEYKIPLTHNYDDYKSNCRQIFQESRKNNSGSFRRNNTQYQTNLQKLQTIFREEPNRDSGNSSSSSLNCFLVKKDSNDSQRYIRGSTLYEEEFINDIGSARSKPKINSLFKEFRKNAYHSSMVNKIVAENINILANDSLSTNQQPLKKSSELDQCLSEASNCLIAENKESGGKKNPKRNFDRRMVINQLTPDQQNSKADLATINDNNEVTMDKWNSINAPAEQLKVIKECRTDNPETIHFRRGYSQPHVSTPNSEIIEELILEQKQQRAKKPEDLSSPTKIGKNALLDAPKTKRRRMSDMNSQTNTMRDLDMNFQLDGKNLANKKHDFDQVPVQQKTKRIIRCESNINFQKKGSIEINHPQKTPEFQQKTIRVEDSKDMLSQINNSSLINQLTKGVKTLSRLNVVDESAEVKYSSKAVLIDLGKNKKNINKMRVAAKMMKFIGKVKTTNEKNSFKNMIVNKKSTMDKSNMVMKYNMHLLKKKKDMGPQDKLFLSVYENQISEFEDMANIYPDLLQNGRDKHGLSQLHVSVITGHDEICKNILNRIIDPNPQENKGNTPLHYAFMSYNNKIIDIQIGHGVNQQLTNDLGKTPWNYLH